MALLGAQLVITIVMISIIQKLGPHYSFARWLLCSTGLIRYLYPTDNELRDIANIPKDKQKPKKGGKGHQNGTTVDTFHIPRNIDVKLETAKVTTLDVVHLRYYAEYQWLVDFSIYTGLVYAATEIYQGFFPLKEEINLSMLWTFLVVMFSTKLLLSLTMHYFKGEESLGERSTCIVLGFVYLLIAMVILIIDESILELGLESAYNSFNQNAAVFLNYQGLNSTGPASKIVLKFCIAVWCAILGAILAFPGLRIARMHWDLLKSFRDRKFMQFLLNISFALPFLLVVAWIKPVSRNYLTVRIFNGMTEPLLTPHAFETIRILAVMFTMFLKIVLMPWYLQAYLNMAYHRVEEQKKEAGRITNKDFQKKIAAVFYYLCVVTLQYIIPIIICLFTCMMYKTLGGYSWKGLFSAPPNSLECSSTFTPSSVLLDDETSTITKSAQEIHLALENLKSVFTPDVFKGLFGFGVWWCCFSYFAATSLGLIYQSYFHNY